MRLQGVSKCLRYQSLRVVLAVCTLLCSPGDQIVGQPRVVRTGELGRGAGSTIWGFYPFATDNRAWMTQTPFIGLF